ncbi:LAETG motif-containing sortase-dependent surface protein, partial [Streptomyces sp. NPDC087437]|uniref:LAETG motif-containing sortase-dependent surface protein n=1 Tax=Streptomyces sp. NPDC087437 TaxID=3365789 RepID=UPI00381FE343
SGPGAPKVPCSEGPGLYTNAPAYAGWINKTMKANPAPKNHHAVKNHHALQTNAALQTVATRSNLAETGTNDNTAPIAGMAATLVVAGAGTTVAARRRKTRSAA